MPAEAGLRARILAAIRRDYPQSTSGVVIFGRPASGTTGPGHPDLFGCALSRFFALEIKTADGKATPLQLDRIRLLRRAGGYVWIVRNELAALKAVFYVKRGGNHPMPDEAIDFDEWLKGVNGTPATPPVVEEEQVEVAAETEAASPEARDFFDAVTDRPAMLAAAATPADESELEVLPDFETVVEVTAEAVVEPTHEEKLADLDARGEALDAEPRTPTVDEVRHALSIQAEADADQNLATLQGDIRTVGERVSMVWDLINDLAGLQVMLINEVRQLRHDFDQAMAEDDDEIPEPVVLPPWTRPVSILPSDPEPAGLGTTKPQRRGRRRQAS